VIGEVDLEAGDTRQRACRSADLERFRLEAPTTTCSLSNLRATSTPTPAPSASAPTSGEKLISLDFKDADVVNLLRILAAESGRNIVSGDDVKGRVSISLKNVTWEQALDTILEVRGLAKVEKDGVIRIVSLDQLTKEKEAQARVEAARRNAEIETRTKLAVRLKSSPWT